MTGYQRGLIAVSFFGWTFLWFEFHLIGVLAPLILPALKLTPVDLGSIITISFLAAFLFSIVTGPLLDRVGRKPMFQITMLATTLFSALQYFITGFLSWAIVRSLVQMFTFSEQAVAATIVTESIPARHRGTAIGIVQSGFPAGLALAGLVGTFIVPSTGWRAAFLLSAIPALVVVWIRRSVREPERFAHVAALRKAIKAGDEDEAKRLQGVYPVDVEQLGHATYRQLFAPDLARTTVALAIWSFINAGVGIAILTFLPVYMTAEKHFAFSQATLIVTIVGFWSIVGYLSAGFVGDRLGRKETSVVYAAIGVVGLLWAIYATSWGSVLAGLLVFGFGNNGMFSCLTALLAEAFPTRVRGTGSSFIEAAFGLGAALFPVLFGALAQARGFGFTYLMLGVVPYVAVIIVFQIMMRRIAPGAEVEAIAV